MRINYGLISIFVANYLFWALFVFFASPYVMSNDACSIETLAQPLQQFIRDEQSFESFTVSSHLKPANFSRWNSPYSPANKVRFTIKGCWLSTEQFENLGGTVLKGPSSAVVRQFFRDHNNENQLLFFVHPDEATVKEYKKIGLDVTSPDFACEDYCATPTSSNRSLFVWSAKPNADFAPVIVKTSINQKFGTSTKNVSTEEARKSFTINKILTEQQASDDDFKNNFRFLKEPLAFSLAPKIGGTNFDSGAGMIVREIPQGLFNGDYRLVTAFALYGTGVTSEDVPYLLTMFKNRLQLDQEIETKLIKPFAADWVKAAIEWGITTESHGQNLLVELDHEGKLNGRLWYRDIDGFEIVATARKLRGLPVDAALKPITLRELEVSLEGKFGLLLTQLEQAVDSWQARGLIDADGSNGNNYESMLKLALQAELAKIAMDNYSLKSRKLEPKDTSQWYHFFTRAVVQLQRMRANDRAAETNSAEALIEEKAGDLFGLEIDDDTIAFLTNRQGNAAQKNLATLRFNQMRRIKEIKDSINNWRR